MSTEVAKAADHAAGFFDFIASLVTTFEGEDLENYYGNTTKRPACMSDMLKTIFDADTDSKYCWTDDGGAPDVSTVSFDVETDAKKSNTCTYYNVSSDAMPVLIDFYKMIVAAPGNYKLWKPVSIGNYPGWIKSLFAGMIRSVCDSTPADEYIQPWLNFKHGGTFCSFTFTKSGADIDMGQVYQMYVEGDDRQRAFRDVRADVSISFPDGAEPIFGLGVSEEFKVAKTVGTNRFRNIMIMNKFIIVPRQLAARLGFRKIHLLTI